MTAARTTTLTFSRFEFKYVLDQATREAVESELGHFVELDPYVQGQPGQRYFVRSLYFDDARLTAFHDKHDGMLARSKFRVRTYGRTIDDGAPWFLEQKGRHNNLVWKHRTPIAAGLDRTLRGDALVRALLRHAGPGDVRDRFEVAVWKRGIRPYVLVDYLRRPYVSRFDPEFRLTFDADLAGCVADTMFPAPAAPRGLLRGYTVMEVKFARHVPAWFHRILQAHQLTRRSISKVCAATEALGLAKADT
ncbi:MAG: polyphosphate polymerase domain-containing protein [Planctomycetes bacterium]|nr:polyphosphate polymerase domain-containing protein [Planctomycetota bacterium]